MDSEYQSMLDPEAKKPYLAFESEELPNPYAVPDKEWVDDIAKWRYLIDSKAVILSNPGRPLISL